MVFTRALQGGVMGCGAPLGWMLIQFFRGVNVASDIGAHPVLYLYLLFGTASVFAGFGLYVGQQEAQLRERSRRDPLTRLCNLRHFREQLDIQIAQSSRDKTPLSLIFFDLDHFKKVNDAYGHAGGDTVLKELCKTVSKVLRRNELFARVGGEEFAIIVPHDTLENAAQVAERIRGAVEGHDMSVGANRQVRVTLSLGVAEHVKDESANQLVERADKAMYEAKRGGRNRVVAR